MFTLDKLAPHAATSTTVGEIRIAWTTPIRFDHCGCPSFTGLWHPDNSENRITLELIVEAGIDAYGLGSHWIQERPA